MGNPTAFRNIITFGERNAPGELASDPDAALSLFFGGVGLMDSRAGYNQYKRGAVGFQSGSVQALNVIPSAISATAIAAVQAAVAGTPLTLAAATANGITPITAANNPGPLPTGNTLPNGSVVIDGIPSVLAIGLDGNISLWNPSTIVQRAIQITSVGNDSGGTFLLTGYDYTGNVVTDRVTGGNAGVVTTLKTFKGITSIVPSAGVSGGNVSVGQADVYQFPLLASGWEQVDVYWNGAYVTANTGYVAPDLTTPATALTGDTRGTYAVQSASNGAKRLVLFVQPTATAIASSPGSLNAALFGVVPA